MQRNLTSSQLCSMSSSSCSQRSSHLFSDLATSSQLFSRLLTSCPPLLNSSQLVLTHLTSVQLAHVFQPGRIVFPFARVVWLVQVAFVLLQGNFTFGATIRTSLIFSSIVLSFTAAPSLFQLSQSFLHSWIVMSPSVWKQITMGRCAFRKSQKSVQKYATQHGTQCASNHLFRLVFGVFYGSKIRNHIVDAASKQSLF
jgi:hypothetical protein